MAQRSYTHYDNEDSWFTTTYYLCNCIHHYTNERCHVCEIESECEELIEKSTKSRNKIKNLWKKHTSKCQRCGEVVYWMKTKNDKNIAVTPNADALEDLENYTRRFDANKHKCHFDECEDIKRQKQEERENTEILRKEKEYEEILKQEKKLKERKRSLKSQIIKI